MGKTVFALATWVAMTTPAFAINFMSLSSDMFEASTFTAQRDDFNLEGYTVPDALLPGFLYEEEDIAFPEM